MATNVPPLEWTDQGLKLPDETPILDGVLADINDAFGGGLNLSLTSPQGQIAQSITAIVGAKNSDILHMIQMMNPSTATGVFQDAIGEIYFIKRLQGAGTVVNCVLTGVPRTVIPAGTLVEDTQGYSYKSLSDVTIGANNQGTGQFQNTTVGAIGAAPNTVNKILVAITGWETITNPEAGILGRDVEGRAAFEARRKRSVSIVGSSNIDSIRAAVLSLNDVIDCYAYSNDTGQDITIGSTNLAVPKSSIYVAVVGGSDAEIAQAIWRKKSSGSAYVGNTSVTVTYPDYPDPAPTTVVKFERPATTNVYFSVTIEDNGELPTDITDQITQAIIDHFTGDDGSERVRIGQTIYASSYYPIITSIGGLTVNILSLTVGLAENPTAVTTTLGVNQTPAISTDTVKVTIKSS